MKNQQKTSAPTTVLRTVWLTWDNIVSNVTARSRVTHCPSPEGLLLQVGNLGGEVRDGHRDVPGGRRGELHLHNKTENVSPHVGVPTLAYLQKVFSLGTATSLAVASRAGAFLIRAAIVGYQTRYLI